MFFVPDLISLQRMYLHPPHRVHFLVDLLVDLFALAGCGVSQIHWITEVLMPISDIHRFIPEEVMMLAKYIRVGVFFVLFSGVLSPLRPSFGCFPPFQYDQQ